MFIWDDFGQNKRGGGVFFDGRKNAKKLHININKII